jgi:hypothetical protein
LTIILNRQDNYLSKKRIRNITKPKQNISQPKHKDFSDRFYIDFTQYPHWIDSINEKYFVNSLKDQNEAAKKFYFIISKIFPDLEEMGKDIFTSKYQHCHKIEGDKLITAKKIIKKIDNLDIGEDVNLWQISAKNARNVRIVGSMVTSDMFIFYPLFIDYHHFLYSSKKYNQRDFKNNKFFPQEEYK